MQQIRPPRTAARPRVRTAPRPRRPLYPPRTPAQAPAQTRARDPWLDTVDFSFTF